MAHPEKRAHLYVRRAFFGGVGVYNHAEALERTTLSAEGCLRPTFSARSKETPRAGDSIATLCSLHYLPSGKGH